MVLGAALIGSEPVVPSYVAIVRPVAEGQVLVAADLGLESLRFTDPADATAYLTGTETVVGQVATRALAPGELVTAAAMRAGGTPRDAVPLAMEPSWVPPGVRVGAWVEIWSAPSRGDGAARLLMGPVPVLAVESRDEALGSGGTQQVTVGLASADRDLLPDVLDQVRDGGLVLVLKGETP